MTSIDRHLERYLGTIARGWGATNENPGGVQVCLFEHQPAPEAVTYATLGLSHHVLAMANDRTVRQELLLPVFRTSASDDLVKLLLHVADQVLERHEAPLRGEVFRLGHPLCAGASCQHLYATIPVIFPDGLATCEETSPPTVCIWLVGITDREARWIDAEGWEAFEDQLEHLDPPLLDPCRASVL